MTTTGEQLVQLSGLLTGSAMAHLLAIQAGDGDIIYSDGVAVTVDFAPYAAEVDTMQVDVEVELSPVLAEVQDTPIAIELALSPIELEITTND